MEITIDSGGGATGLRRRLGPIATGPLGDVGAEIEAKVAEIGFFDLPERLGKPNPGPWRRFVVVDGDRSRSVFCPTMGSPPATARSLGELEAMLIEAGGRFSLIEAPGVVEPEEDPGVGWEAWYNRMPGVDDPRLHVAGTVELRSSMATATLELGNVGTVPEATVVLRLTIEYPDTYTDDMDNRLVTWVEDAGPDVERVRIVGDAEAEIEVTVAV